jgi:ribonucleotide monophosphatase NagD (HAD superfamily)
LEQRRGFETAFEGESGQEVRFLCVQNSWPLHQENYRRPYLLLEDEVRKECSEGLSDDDAIPHDSVVLGLAPSLLDYEHLNTAFQILTREPQTSTSPSEKPPLIVTHKAKYLRAPDNRLSLSLGPFVAALESASGVEAMAIGKPTRPFFEGAISSLQLNSRNDDKDGRIAVIGDDVEGDLGEGAVDLGLWRILGSFLHYLHPIADHLLSPLIYLQ